MGFAGRYAPPFPSHAVRRESLAGRRAAGAAPAHDATVQVLALAHRAGGRRSHFWSPRKGVGRMAGAMAGSIEADTRHRAGAAPRIYGLHDYTIYTVKYTVYTYTVIYRYGGEAQMDEQKEQTSSPSSGPVTIEDVREAIGDTDPHRTNAGTIRQRIGRGSLSTIQKHLEALRRQQRVAEGIDTAQDEIVAPEAPKGLLRGIWESAYGVALATVQDRLIRAQERAAMLEHIEEALSDEVQTIVSLVVKTESERDEARAEAKAAREAQVRAEAERDEALRLRDQIAALMAKIDAMQAPAS